MRIGPSSKENDDHQTTIMHDDDHDDIYWRLAPLCRPSDLPKCPGTFGSLPTCPCVQPRLLATAPKLAVGVNAAFFLLLAAHLGRFVLLVLYG
jgi:hypothetical protein